MKKCTHLKKVRSTINSNCKGDRRKGAVKSICILDDTYGPATDKPLISILLAVYNPKYSWLKEQLISLNNQSYENLELIVYDDCSEKPLDEDFVKKYIFSFRYTIIRGNKNIGSNKAFEELTKKGNGEYFAYCDQDDIWEVNKIQILINKLIKENSILVYSDMSVIDKDGCLTHSSLIQAKPRIKYTYGEGLFNKFFFNNCVSGCCMLVNSEIARKAIPFSEVTIHDQWLCIIASIYGTISYVDKPLVKYRIHGDNQTASLKGVFDKEDYYNLRVNILKKRLEEIKNIASNVELDKIEDFCDARIKKKLIKLFKYKYLSEKEAIFEIVIKYMPNFLFKLILKKLK
ncbi:MAG: glycosyltransferase family 2 protein [Clostridium beijerinckii]|jgi:glycosyltransferase involved in cell wall biosynthesis|nr:glycosyltransferase family 2 protein [Clostridium beijerinckii]MCI1583259.1 glycosyltransferase family 2 protein [Clostridium beijerinckii]MCI1621159.1 glycosyltransferase family 2 protein [Clostridium beijerinckii]